MERMNEVTTGKLNWRLTDWAAVAEGTSGCCCYCCYFWSCCC